LNRPQLRNKGGRQYGKAKTPLLQKATKKEKGDIQTMGTHHTEGLIGQASDPAGRSKKSEGRREGEVQISSYSCNGAEMTSRREEVPWSMPNVLSNNGGKLPWAGAPRGGRRAALMEKGGEGRKSNGRSMRGTGRK